MQVKGIAECHKGNILQILQVVNVEENRMKVFNQEAH